MKNLLLTLLLLPALAAAKVPVEEDIVAKTSDPDSPFYYTSLMMRYNAGDETLTDEDYHYLYYGYAHQESYKPMEANPDLDKLLMLASGLDPDNPLAETLDAMLYVGEDALARDPFSPKILNLMAYAHGALGNKLQEKMYYNKVKGVLRAIEDSGDALTQKTPRHILMFDHALDVMASEGYTYGKSRLYVVVDYKRNFPSKAFAFEFVANFRIRAYELLSCSALCTKLQKRRPSAHRLSAA